MNTSLRPVSALLGAAALTVLAAAPALADHGHRDGHRDYHATGSTGTLTPIKHVVVIFQENVSFDHYFATYPHAANPAGEPRFAARPGTPSVNGLDQALLEHNPNAANPQRLDRSEALTCDMDHRYADEQKAFHGGLMDKFVEYTERSSCSPPNVGKPGLVMDYYDGNTVTAMWNYAQYFAMSDNSFGTTFGPSTTGALNLVAGQTHGGTPTDIPNTVANGTVIGDPDPAYDDCSSTKYQTVAMTGTNVGDLLSDKGITWGWFQGGFRPTSMDNGKAVCGATRANVGGHPGLRLQPPPRTVPVLHLHRQSPSPAAHLRRHDRQER